MLSLVQKPVPVKERLLNMVFFLLLAVLAGILFFLSHPNFIVTAGIPFIAFFCYIPVFYICSHSEYKLLWLYGLVYGIVSYALYGFWMGGFHPFALILACGTYGCIMAVLFLLMHMAADAFAGAGFLAQWCLWCGYEYLRTCGFAGFSYGITAYTQWQNPYLVPCAAAAGIWLLNAVIVFPSAWAADIIKCKPARIHVYTGLCWLCLFSVLLIYGKIQHKKITEEDKSFQHVTVTAVQNNSDPWIGGVDSYKKDIDTLISLTESAQKQQPASFVIWPETAVVPSLVYQYESPTDKERQKLVQETLEWADKQQFVFITGNDRAEDDGGLYLTDYNSVLVFIPGKNVIPPEPFFYDKTHLVPFTEYFPYEKQLPGLYKALLNGDTHMWTPGRVKSVFCMDELTFAAPVCFEDTFGEDCRQFCIKGARALFNLSNDAWAHSAVCQKQHLSMAVFRAAENRIPVIRSTASGQTCFIGRDGMIRKEAEPFKETSLTVQMPVIPQNYKCPPYTKYGDWLGIVFAAASGILCVTAIIKGLCIKLWNKNKK